jgi:protein phosphatase
VRDRTDILLWDPCLVVLVGAAGAGKSTLAARWFQPEEILSSDSYRARVAGDPSDQRATRPAFAALHRDLRRRLADGRLAVVDATNVTSGARAALLRIAAETGVPAVAIVLDLPDLLVRARNTARPGRLAVPEPAVDRQLRSLRSTLAAGRLEAEGFAAAWVVRTEGEVEAVAISRRPAPRPGTARPAGGGASRRA